MKRGRILALAVLSTLLISCGSPKEPEGRSGSTDEKRRAAAGQALEAAIQQESGDRFDVEVTGGTFRIRGGKRGRDYIFAAGGKVTMPRGFPENIPLFPGAALRMAQESGQMDSTVIMGTGAAVSEVSEFYRKEMPSRGWKLMAEADLEGEKYLSFETEKEAVAVVVAPAVGETVISVAYKARSDQG